MEKASTSKSDGITDKGYREADTGLVPLRNAFLFPTSKLDDQKFEFYFLVDVSGSMEGEPWDLASRALLLFLQSLPEDCYFNIISFASAFKCMFPKSVKYGQETLELARERVPSLYTGGLTEIYEPLEYIYSQEQVPGYLTQIFSITDGDVSSRDEVLRLILENVHHSRCFSLGIGDFVDLELVMGIANNAGGTYEFVDSSEFIESKILNQLKISLQPGLLKPKRDASKSRLEFRLD